MVRRLLAVAAMAVLVGAPVSVASASPASAYVGGSIAPKAAGSAVTHTRTVADIRPTAPAHKRAATKPKAVAHHAARKPAGNSFSAFENTRLNLTPTKSSAASTGSGGDSIVRTLIGLLVVVGAIYGVAWVLRRVKRSREEQGSGNGLASIATLPLGGGRTLHLVRAGTDVILVGSSEHGVAPIRVYTEEEALANGVLSDGGQDAALRAAGEAFVAGSSGASPSPAIAANGSGQWRPIDDDARIAPASVIDTLRRLTVRS